MRVERVQKVCANRASIFQFAHHCDVGEKIFFSAHLEMFGASSYHRLHRTHAAVAIAFRANMRKVS